MNQMTKTIKQIPSLEEFIFPEDRIKQYVDDLSMYYQLVNQESVELYSKWKGKQNFSGTMGQMVRLSAIRQLIDSAHGKDWVVLIKAIFLLENYTTVIDMVRCYCGLDFFPTDGYDTERHLGSSEHLFAIQKDEKLKDMTEESFIVWSD